MQSTTFDDYVETLIRRYHTARSTIIEKAWGERPNPPAILDEIAWRAASDFTNNERFRRDRLGAMLEQELNQLNTRIREVTNAIAQNDYH